MSTNPTPSGPPSGSASHAALFAAIFEHALDAIFLIDDARRFVDANPAACQLLGFTRAEMREQTIADVTPEEDGALIPETWAAFQQDGWSRKNWRFRAKDGTGYIVDVSCTANILPGFHLTVARDVTAQKKAEAEADLLRRALDALNQGIMITDHQSADEPLVYMNPAVARIAGYEANELLGKNCRTFQGTHREQPGLDEVRAALREGRECLVELVNQRKNGEDWVNLLSLTPVRDSAGAITHFVGVQTDVTRLRGYLGPLHPARSAAAPPAAPRGTVLVVEDEDAVREFVRLVLEQAGYAVLPTANAEQALDVYRADPYRIDLVLTDVVMPARSGPELAADLARIRPNVRVVFMSGYTGGINTHPAELPSGTPFLEKPFSLDRLLHVVASACAE